MAHWRERTTRGGAQPRDDKGRSSQPTPCSRVTGTLVTDLVLTTMQCHEHCRPCDCHIIQFWGFTLRPNIGSSQPKLNNLISSCSRASPQPAKRATATPQYHTLLFGALRLSESRRDDCPLYHSVVFWVLAPGHSPLKPRVQYHIIVPALKLRVEAQ